MPAWQLKTCSPTGTLTNKDTQLVLAGNSYWNPTGTTRRPVVGGMLLEWNIRPDMLCNFLCTGPFTHTFSSLDVTSCYSFAENSRHLGSVMSTEVMKGILCVSPTDKTLVYSGNGNYRLEGGKFEVIIVLFVWTIVQARKQPIPSNTDETLYPYLRGNGRERGKDKECLLAYMLIWPYVFHLNWQFGSSLFEENKKSSIMMQYTITHKIRNMRAQRLSHFWVLSRLSCCIV